MLDDDDLSLDDAMDELSSAEDFLDFFSISYDPSIVHVNRLHILQRFNEYLGQSDNLLPEGEEARRAVYAKMLERAYQDFVESNALTEKVFKVFRMHEPQETFVSLDSLTKG